MISDNRCIARKDEEVEKKNNKYITLRLCEIPLLQQKMLHSYSQK